MDLTCFYLFTLFLHFEFHICKAQLVVCRDVTDPTLVISCRYDNFGVIEHYCTSHVNNP